LETTVKMLDKIKSLGFNYATKAGLSIGIDDMVIPDSKKGHGTRRRKQSSTCSSSIRRRYTNGERYTKVIEIWSA